MQGCRASSRSCNSLSISGFMRQKDRESIFWLPLPASGCEPFPNPSSNREWQKPLHRRATCPENRVRPAPSAPGAEAGSAICKLDRVVGVRRGLVRAAINVHTSSGEMHWSWQSFPGSARPATTSWRAASAARKIRRWILSQSMVE